MTPPHDVNKKKRIDNLIIHNKCVFTNAYINLHIIYKPIDKEYEIIFHMTTGFCTLKIPIFLI